MFWSIRSRRSHYCRHKWKVCQIAKEKFEATDACEWCGRIRVRGLLAKDEEDLRNWHAFVSGCEISTSIMKEWRFERSKGFSADFARMIALRKDLVEKKLAVSRAIRAAEAGSQEHGDQTVGELRSHLRGLNSPNR